MWRVHADAEIGVIDRMRVFRGRINQFEDLQDDEFKARYRFPKEILKDVLDLINPALERHTHRSQSLEPGLQLCTAVRYFSQGGFLPVIGDLHGISDRAASKCIHTVAAAMCDNMNHFIRYLTENEVMDIQQKFYRKSHGFPKIAGLIDGTQVTINGPHPPANEVAFINRKGVHAINCQVVCDSRMRIYSFDASWPGSNHDAYILRMSEVYDKFSSGEMPNCWLLGDSGYPLNDWLLTPYQNPLGQGQIRYNECHKETRSGVERCIGMLKMRWRCLTKPIMFQPACASRVIAACAALHNHAVVHRLELDEPIDGDIMEEFAAAANANVRGQHGLAHVARDDLVRRVFSNDRHQ